MKQKHLNHSAGIAIIDIADVSLSAEDREILQHPLLAGIILFTRNYENPEQLHSLIKEIKRINSTLHIAVDQEGGRVQRFREGFTDLPAMSHWGKRYQEAPKLAKHELKLAITQLIRELITVGITIDLIPVLDLNQGVSEVIGERSLSSNPDTVIELATIVIDTLHANGMPAIGKHFPGHGGVTLDSHQDLPIDDRDWQSLWIADVKPFVQLAPKLDAIMPAHIIYSQIDSVPATFSYKLLNDILKKQLKFDGLIITDDLSMQAAASVGSYADRAKFALEAGCDRLLVCNNRKGAIEVLESLEVYSH